MGLLISEQGTSRIILFVTVGFIVVAGGSYLFTNVVGLTTIVVLSIIGILVGGAWSAWLYLRKVSKAPSTPVTRSVPRIASGWEYRPKKAIRRYAAVDRVNGEAVDTVISDPPEANTSDDVWFSFINVDRASKDATTNAPISV